MPRSRSAGPSTAIDAVAARAASRARRPPCPPSSCAVPPLPGCIDRGHRRRAVTPPRVRSAQTAASAADTEDLDARRDAEAAREICDGVLARAHAAKRVHASPGGRRRRRVDAPTIASPLPVKLSMRVEAAEELRGSRDAIGSLPNRSATSRRSIEQTVSAALGSTAAASDQCGARDMMAGCRQTGQRGPAAQQVAERARKQHQDALGRRGHRDRIDTGGVRPVLIRQGMTTATSHRPARRALRPGSDRQHSSRAAQPAARTGARRGLGQARESYNPGGSVKDRICLAMIEAAERDGRLAAGRHDHRADERQHRHRPRAGRGGEGLSPGADHARHDEHRAAQSAARPTARRSVLTPDTQGMHARGAQGRGDAATDTRLLHAAAVQQSGQPGGPSRRPPRRSCCGSSSASTRSSPASAPAARSPASARCLREAMPGVADLRRRAGVVARCSRTASPATTRSRASAPASSRTILDENVYDEVITVSDEDAARVHAPPGARRGHPGGHLVRRQLPRRAARWRVGSAPARAVVTVFCRHRRALSHHRRLSSPRASDVDETAKLAALRACCATWSACWSRSPAASTRASCCSVAVEESSATTSSP